MGGIFGGYCIIVNTDKLNGGLALKFPRRLNPPVLSIRVTTLLNQASIGLRNDCISGVAMCIPQQS
jgi:hypothetical protein